MVKTLRFLLFKFFQSFLDVLPILLVITFFQLVIIQKPFPHLKETLFGFILVVIGLFIFIQGLENALFPIGERLAVEFALVEFALKGNVYWIVLFGFTLGFATTIAEPALTVISQKAGHIAARLLTNFNVSYAMVIESNQVVGMVSLNRIVTNWDIG